MKLGMSMACYRWELYPHLQRTQPTFAYLGRPFLYCSSMPLALIPEEEGLNWLLNRCSELDLRGLYVASKLFANPDFARRYGETAASRGIEIFAVGSLDWVVSPEARPHEMEAFAKQLEVARDLGARIVDTTHTGNSRNNHFSRNPPIDEQIGMMVENFKEAADLASHFGLVVALENHLDYRCSEIAQVLRSVDSRWLRAMFDTGNSIGVIEDPVDAAKSVGPYTVMCHFKDFRISPMSIDAVPRIFLSPIGRGSLDLEAVLQVLQQDAPDPDHLTLCLEAISPWEEDSDLWVRDNLRYIREHFARFLS